MKIRSSVEFLVLALFIISAVFHTLEYNLSIVTNAKTIVLVISIGLSVYMIYMGSLVGQIKLMLGLSFLGNEIFLMCLPIIFLPKLIVRFAELQSMIRLAFVLTLFLLYSVVLLVVSNVADFSPFSIFFWFLSFSGILLIFIFYTTFDYTVDDAENILTWLRKIIIIQLPIMLIQAMIHRDFNPGDSWTGSSGNSVLAGCFLCLLALSLIIPYFVQGGRISLFSFPVTANKIATVLLIGVALYFNDSKMIVLGILFAAIVYLLYLALVRYLASLRGMAFIKTIAIFCLAGVSLIVVYQGLNYYGEAKYGFRNGLSELEATYLDFELRKDGTNAKTVLYKRAYIDMIEDGPVEWILGIGPGKFGSKASNIMATDVLHKEEGQAQLPAFIAPYSSKWTKRYMSDLWTKDIAETSRYRSATLSFPFAGLVTIKAEYGLVGLLLFFGFIFSAPYYLLKAARGNLSFNLGVWTTTVGVFWISLPFHMLFDNFHEKQYIMLPLLLVTAVLCRVKAESFQDGKSKD